MRQPLSLVKENHQPGWWFQKALAMSSKNILLPYFPESQKDLKRMKAHLEDVFSGKFQLEDDIVRLK